MTQLLVSVRNATEARLAIAGGADLIDVKEPRRGSLGPVDPSVLQSIIETAGSARPLSAALGELLLDDVSLLATQLAAVDFVKIALAGCETCPDWSGRLGGAFAQLPEHVKRVAVAYADFQQANAPPPTDVLRAAVKLDCCALLVDTFSKSHGNLLHHLSLDELRTLRRDASEQGLLTVFAGSLRLPSLRQVLDLRPSFIAVRGAVCRHGRTGPLDAALVKELAELVEESNRREHARCSAPSMVKQTTWTASTPGER